MLSKIPHKKPDYRQAGIMESRKPAYRQKQVPSKKNKKTVFAVIIISG
jgi:hypothetical protein